MIGVSIEERIARHVRASVVISLETHGRKGDRSLVLISHIQHYDFLFSERAISWRWL
jgi:hypothetical protein